MNILVVGAGKGIGFEAVKSLLGDNNKVLAASRNLAALEELSHEDLQTFKCDLGEEEDIKDLISHIHKIDFYPERVLITAGVLVKKSYQELSREDFLTCFNINVYGVFDLIRKVVPLMKKESKGHIVTIGSMGGIYGTLKFPGMIFYSSSKAALGCLTECLAEELKEDNIHINCLALGAVETDMKNQAFPEYKAPHTSEEMGRYIAGFIIKGGDFFNGKVLPVSVSVP